jgi:MYXO-CTERM domain-containing protein
VLLPTGEADAEGDSNRFLNDPGCGCASANEASTFGLLSFAALAWVRRRRSLAR